VHSDHVFGAVSINAERKPLASIAHPFLVQGWTADVQDTPFPDVKGVLWTLTVPDKTKRADEWVAEQVWGYADHDIPGKGTEKRYTRRIHFESPALTKDVLLVYDLKDGGMTSGSGTTTSTDEEEEDLGSFGGS
jgi:hypothetical protein